MMIYLKQLRKKMVKGCVITIIVMQLSIMLLMMLNTFKNWESEMAKKSFILLIWLIYHTDYW